MNKKEAIKEVEQKTNESITYKDKAEKQETEHYYRGRVDAFNYCWGIIHDITDL